MTGLRRLYLQSDIAAMLDLKNANAPAVDVIDRTDLEFLTEHSLYSFAIVDKTLNALCVTFEPGATYTSANY